MDSRPLPRVAIWDKTRGARRTKTKVKSTVGQIATYWQPVWHHHRFVVYSWVLTAWLVSTLAEFSRTTAPTFPDSLPIACTAMVLAVYRYLPIERIRFRVLSPWYVVLWSLLTATGLSEDSHLWWQCLLVVFTVPLLSHWIDELLQYSERQSGVITAIWAFISLFQLTMNRVFAHLQLFSGSPYICVLLAVILALLKIFWPSSPETDQKNSEDSRTSLRMISFAVVGIILLVTQAFLAIVGRIPVADASPLYALEILPILGAVVIFPLLLDFMDTLMLYLSITLSGVAIILLEAHSFVWLSLPLFLLARNLVIFWWIQAINHFRHAHKAFISIMLSASLLLAAAGREIGVWWLSSVHKFPIEEWSGIVLFLVVPSTISFIVGNASQDVVNRNQQASAIDIDRKSQDDLAGDQADVASWAQSLSLHLTPQELRVCEALLAGMNHAQIATELYISPNTLKTHLHNIYRKTGVKNRFELVTLMTQGKVFSSSPLSRR